MNGPANKIATTRERKTARQHAKKGHRKKERNKD